MTSTVTASNKTYDGNPSATILTRTLVGVVGMDDVTVGGGSATFKTKNVGTGKMVSVSGMTITGANVANYSFSGNGTTTADITAKPLAVTAVGNNKAYDGNTTATVAHSDDRVMGDVLTFTYTGTFASADAGTGIAIAITGITLGGADAGNYSANASTTTSADITAANQTITFPTPGTKTYCDLAFALTGSASSGLTVAYTSSSLACSVSGSTVTLLAAGMCTVSASQAGNGNYNPASNNGIFVTFTVNPNPNPVNVMIPDLTTLTGVAISIPVNLVTSASGHDIVAFGFVITYDPAVVSYVGIDQTMTLSNGWTVAVSSSTPGTLRVSGLPPAGPPVPLSGLGTLLKFNFNVVGLANVPTCSPVTFSQNTLPVTQPIFESNFGSDPLVGIDDGLVCIENGTMDGRITYGNSQLPGAALRGIPNATLTATANGIPVPVSPTTITTATLATTGDVGKYTLTGFLNSGYGVIPTKVGGYTIGAGQHISSNDASLIQQYVIRSATL